MDFNNPECCTCLEDYSRQKMPVVLPCGHAICESCFELLKVGDYIICPQDKIESYAKKLAPAYDMIFLIEQHTNLKKHLHEQKLLFEKICEENNKKMLDAIEIAKASGIQQMVGQLEIIQSENERNFNSQIEEIRKNESEKSQILIEEIKLMEKEKRNIDLEKIKHSNLNKINEEMKCFTEKHFKNLRRKMKNGKIRLENFQEIDYNNYRDRELRNDNRIYWASKNQDEVWKEYGENLGIIESAFRAGYSEITIKSGNKRLLIDFSGWREVDLTSPNKFKRSLKRVNTIMAEPRWKAMKIPLNWTTFEMPESFTIEKAWIAQKDSTRIIGVDGKSITCDFKNFTCKIDKSQKIPLMRDTIN